MENFKASWTYTYKQQLCSTFEAFEFSTYRAWPRLALTQFTVLGTLLKNFASERSGLNLSKEEDMLSESCTQTDSLSIPITYDFGTQTDESSSSHHLENSTAGCVTDASDATTVSTAVIVFGFTYLSSSCPGGHLRPYLLLEG